VDSDHLPMCLTIDKSEEETAEEKGKGQKDSLGQGSKEEFQREDRNFREYGKTESMDNRGEMAVNQRNGK